MIVLEPEEWSSRAAAHAARVDTFVQPHLERRASSVKHPVHDFLFTYYSQRPAQLRRWHPGYGVALRDAAAYASLKGYGPTTVPNHIPQRTGGSSVEEVAQRPSRNHVTVTDEYVASQRPMLESLHRLLTATAGRPATFGCFGLHEWAMVYRADETRHDWPLRLGRDGTDEVVDSHRISCSHFDAFRFFTSPAVALNALTPGRDDRAAYEQPGCLHAGMDLYKHAFRLTPMVPSELVADCFELARDIRVLDMRAAPYDLRDLGFQPVRIETAEGKQEYAARQREFARRGQPLRRRLIEQCERLMSVAAAAAVA